ncbi:MAG TPA: DUF2252 domain-containing protein [Baekduia sp.]|jgi:uncharacterized protein (DUF2252 family)|nr:DUF2252 domain-containing protein [Baekduia sp.]
MAGRPIGMKRPPGAARGKAARAGAPRSSHAAWVRAADRADPVDVLLAQAQTRMPELVPIRHGRMLRSPSAFFRGTAAIMAADLAATPTSGIRVQLCGDAHLANFGAFAAPDRSLVFDLNDFDETLPGPWEWDVKRLAASIAVTGRDRGFPAAARAAAVCAAVGAYRQAMLEFAAMRTLDVWYARVDVERQFTGWSENADAERRLDLDRAIVRARRKDSLRALAKLTHDAGGEPRIISDPPLVVPIDELVAEGEGPRVRARLVSYLGLYAETLTPDRRLLFDGYRPVDVAHKVVGVGSVGTRAWIVLLLGRDAADPLFLQLKEAEDSALAPFAGPSRLPNQGRRVVEGQRLMQAAGDVLLGWLRVAEDLDGRARDYYVRQLWDAKASAPLDRLPQADMETYGELCGWTLARAHARAGDRFAIAAYLGSGDVFDEALAEFAETYADQNARDYAALQDAVSDGTLAADLDC